MKKIWLRPAHSFKKQDLDMSQNITTSIPDFIYFQENPHLPNSHAYA